MCLEIKERRKALGVSLDELAAALGPGFSRARLSIAERGLIELSDAEQEIVLAAIERIGELRSDVRDVGGVVVDEVVPSVDIALAG